MSNQTPQPQPLNQNNPSAQVPPTQVQPHGIVLAFNVNDGACFRACLEAGVNAAASWFFKIPTQAGIEFFLR